MQSFLKLLILKKSGKHSNTVKLPKYKKAYELSICTIQGRSCRIQKDGHVAIGLTKEFREKYQINERRIMFTIPKNIRGVSEFKEIRIIPQFNGKQFSIEFIYESNKNLRQSVGNGYMAIDLGLNNLVASTIFSNGGVQQFLIAGRILKNINHYYNKKVAILKGEYNRKGINHNTKRSDSSNQWKEQSHQRLFQQVRSVDNQQMH